MACLCYVSLIQAFSNIKSLLRPWAKMAIKILFSDISGWFLLMDIYVGCNRMCACFGPLCPRRLIVGTGSRSFYAPGCVLRLILGVGSIFCHPSSSFFCLSGCKLEPQKPLAQWALEKLEKLRLKNGPDPAYTLFVASTETQIHTQCI